MSTFTIDKLVTELDLDTSKLEAGLKNTTENLDGFGKKVLSSALGFASWDLAKNVVVGLGGTIKDLTVGVISQGDKFDALSQKVGINVEKLSAYDHVAKLSNTTLEGMTNGIKKLSQNMMDAANGTGEGQKAFQALGISVTDSNGKLKDADSMLIEVAKEFNKMEDGTTKTALAMDLFGRSGTDLIPMLNQGADGIRGMLVEGQALRGWTTDQAKQAAELGDNFDKLKAGVGGIGDAIGKGLIPAGNELVGVMNDWLKNNKELITVRIDTLMNNVTIAAKTLAPYLERGLDLTMSIAGASSKVVGWISKIIVGYKAIYLGITDSKEAAIQLVENHEKLVASIGKVTTEMLLSKKAEDIFNQRLQLTFDMIGKMPYEVEALQKQYNELGNELDDLTKKIAGTSTAAIDGANKAISINSVLLKEQQDRIQKIHETAKEETKDATKEHEKQLKSYKWLNDSEVKDFSISFTEKQTIQEDFYKDSTDNLTGYYKKEDQRIKDNVKKYGDAGINIVDVKKWETNERNNLNKQVHDTEIEQYNQRALASNDMLAGMKAGYFDMVQHQMTWGQVGFDVFKATTNGMREQFGSVFEDMFHNDLKDASDYFDAFKDSLIKSFSGMLGAMATEMVTKGIVNLIGGMFGVPLGTGNTNVGGGTGGGMGGIGTGITAAIGAKIGSSLGLGSLLGGSAAPASVPMMGGYMVNLPTAPAAATPAAGAGLTTAGMVGAGLIAGGALATIAGIYNFYNEKDVTWTDLGWNQQEIDYAKSLFPKIDRGHYQSQWTFDLELMTNTGNTREIGETVWDGLMPHYVARGTKNPKTQGPGGETLTEKMRLANIQEARDRTVATYLNLGLNDNATYWKNAPDKNYMAHRGGVISEQGDFISAGEDGIPIIAHGKEAILNEKQFEKILKGKGDTIINNFNIQTSLSEQNAQHYVRKYIAPELNKLRTKYNKDKLFGGRT